MVFMLVAVVLVHCKKIKGEGFVRELDAVRDPGRDKEAIRPFLRVKGEDLRPMILHPEFQEIRAFLRLENDPLDDRAFPDLHLLHLRAVGGRVRWDDAGEMEQDHLQPRIPRIVFV